MRRLTVAAVVVLSILAILGPEAAAPSQPDGQLAIAFDVSIAPSFLDPAETPGIGTPFVFLYAMHDALIKPLPGNDMAPCLAESWRESPDGLVYEFRLREGLRFHNGDPFTAEDVKFSFHRYRGAAAKLLHDRVKSVDVVDPHRVRFVLHSPWPDFLTFYVTPATGANSLAQVGIRTRVRSMERATFFEAWRAKKLSGVIMAASAGLGNASARLEAFVITTGTYAYGGYPEIDDLFRQQAQERDRKKREALLHQIQKIMHERVMHAPIFEPATLHGVGPRVEEPAIGLNPLLYFAAPYEDMRLKKP
jgi:ABC-type transport system substrate-binding protein